MKSPFIRLALTFAVFLIGSVGFIALADEVRDGETQQVDEAVLQSINAQSSPFLDTFFIVTTQLGGVAGIIIITLGLIAILGIRKSYRKATLLAASVAGAAALNIAFKYIFERARPDLWEQLVIETSFSFPSGHAMASSALAFAVMVIAWNTRYRWFAIAGGGLFVLVVGVSRLYLGVHYPTDIVAGWLLSAAWVAAVTGVLFYARKRK